MIVEPEIIEISSDSDSNSPSLSSDNFPSPSISLLLEMLSTHLSCTQHSNLHSPNSSTPLSNSVDLPAFTSFLKGTLPQSYPQTGKIGYTESLNEQQCLKLFCGVGSGSDGLSIADLSIRKNNSNFPIECFYDIDSFIAKASSLAIAKNGIRVQFCPNSRQNLTQDLHLKVPLTETFTNWFFETQAYSTTPYSSLSSRHNFLIYSSCSLYFSTSIILSPILTKYLFEQPNPPNIHGSCFHTKLTKALFL